MATCALISMLNFIIFFFATRKAPGRTYTQKNYRKAEKRADKARKNAGSFNERFYNANSEKSTWDSANKPYINPRGTKHRCAVCNRTELDGDNLTFRFCTKCAGNLEYCQDHCIHIYMLQVIITIRIHKKIKNVLKERHKYVSINIVLKKQYFFLLLL